ncbi:MAG TPA: NAD-dependent epimerase/dehydratase family protein [Thermoanaerobaculia bacterium]|nr:NAD-dependent epimerase/dehydratase family protein [Thermoanaerobaculia bacterium]
MRVLVIGGTTFMGREIVRRLEKRGHAVAILHRRDRHDLGPTVRNIQADRSDLATLDRILRTEPFEAVVDTAYDWSKGTTPEQVEAAARSANRGLHRYVFMSSIAAYGGGLDRREDDPLAPPDHPVAYVQHKAQAERALFRLHAEDGLPVATFRPPFVYGPRQPFYREQFFWDRLLDGRPIILPDGGEQLMQWVFVDDVAEACVRAVEVDKASGEAFNIAHEAPISQRGLVEALARAAGVEPRLVSVPRERILAAGGNPFAGNLYFGEHLDIPPITEIVEKAQRILGVEITPFEDGLRAAFAWYRGQPRRAVDYGFEEKLLTAV